MTSTSTLNSVSGSGSNSSSFHEQLSALSGSNGGFGFEPSPQQPQGPILTLDASTAKLMYQTSQEMSSYVQQIANEPTIGLFHVQDHIRRNIPKNVELKKNIKSLGEKIEEKSFDIDYSTKTVISFSEIETFSNISTLLQSSIEKANKLVNNKSLLFINSQVAPPSSSKTFASFQQQHKIYQQQNSTLKSNNTSFSNYGTLSDKNDSVQTEIKNNENEKVKEKENI